MSADPRTTRRTAGRIPTPRTGPPTALVLLGVLALALNLRPAAVSVGPLLTEVRADLGLSATAAGLLTSLPVLAFALVGASAPAVAARLGLYPALLLALALVGGGLVVRALVGSAGAFLMVSFVALGGMAMANVLLPSVVRRDFPGRVGQVTSLYTTVLAAGLTAAFALTVPLADLGGSWRVGLGAWAVPALIATAVWVVIVLRRARGAERSVSRDAAASPQVRIGYAAVARTRLGWAMVVMSGMQSMLAYAIFGWFATLWRDSGWSSSAAGLLLALLALAAVPMSYLAPRVIASGRHHESLMVAICACYPVGFAGLLLGPRHLDPLWAVVVGVATSTFPVVLVLVGLRARTPEGTAALSGFTQSLGYLFAAIGPFAVGLLHDTTGAWTVPLLAMSLVVVPLLAAGLLIVRLPMLEDELRVGSTP